jgi:hypothetical protein
MQTSHGFSELKRKPKTRFAAGNSAFLRHFFFEPIVSKRVGEKCATPRFI